MANLCSVLPSRRNALLVNVMSVSEQSGSRKIWLRCNLRTLSLVTCKAVTLGSRA
jgi:hypothetical protein